jgi:hypothetical protein
MPASSSRLSSLPLALVVGHMAAPPRDGGLEQNQSKILVLNLTFLYFLPIHFNKLPFLNGLS